MAPRVKEKSFASAVALLAASIGIDAGYVHAEPNALETLNHNLAGKLPTKSLKYNSDYVPGGTQIKIDGHTAPANQLKIDPHYAPPGEYIKIGDYQYKEQLPAVQHKVSAQSNQYKVLPADSHKRVPTNTGKWTDYNSHDPGVSISTTQQKVHPNAVQQKVTPNSE